MKTFDQYYFRQCAAAIAFFAVIVGQQTTAQSYFNINFSNNDNKYSLITEVKSITFDESGGIVVKKTDNSVTTETLTLLKSITLDESSGGGTPLSVELVSFSASMKRANVELMWETATEKNNYGFEIERVESVQHLQGVGHVVWEKIGFVEGSGTTNSAKEYSYNDKPSKSGTYLYRLKQIDRDGKFGYSHEVEVIIGAAPLQFELSQNYPNPFNPTTTISFQLSNSGLTTLKVYDMIGREVATLVNGMKDAGDYSVTFDASKLSSGIYFSRLQSANKMQIKTMSLIK